MANKKKKKIHVKQSIARLVQNAILKERSKKDIIISLATLLRAEFFQKYSHLVRQFRRKIQPCVIFKQNDYGNGLAVWSFTHIGADVALWFHFYLLLESRLDIPLLRLTQFWAETVRQFLHYTFEAVFTLDMIQFRSFSPEIN